MANTAPKDARHRSIGFPACFGSKEQYASWVDVARAHSPGGHGYCADCTPGYQAEMLAHNRCAYPTTTFKPGEDGELEGVRAIEDRRAQKTLT